MSKRKKQKQNTEEEGPQILGRFSGNLKMGLVGISSCGKSLTYDVLSRKQVAKEEKQILNMKKKKENQFEARCLLQDPRHDFLTNLYEPKKTTPTYLLVQDFDSFGESSSGFDNSMLTAIQSVDGFFHVVRAFSSRTIHHPLGSVDPVRDMEIVENELIQRDIQGIIKKIASLEKQLRNIKDLKKNEDLQMLKVFKKYLEEKNLPIRQGKWNNKEIFFLNTLALFSSKPVVYLINISVKDFKRKGNKHLRQIMEWIKKRTNEPIIPFCPVYEDELFYATEEEKEKEGFKTVIPKIISTGFTRLNLITYFTVGKDEVKSWKCRKGSNAPQAARVIHTSLEKTFIAAEVFHYNDIFELGSEQKVRKAGKFRREGKKYIVKDGDCIEFINNKTSTTKKKK
ncbi:obg-like atpase [Anaeramoeba flamelloides]|uniref:Obg-like ATPase homolog n=1 Tax=Anaeramoeba flamelloides TaxID=1746091 RepID=A0AAV8A4V6_9EUKA|nr:obg-like atpase [Anaeramoeba flamelloides]